MKMNLQVKIHSFALETNLEDIFKKYKPISFDSFVHVEDVETVLRGKAALRKKSALKQKLLMNFEFEGVWEWCFGYITKYYTKATCDKKTGIYKSVSGVKATTYKTVSNEVYFTADKTKYDLDLGDTVYISEPSENLKCEAFCFIVPLDEDGDKECVSFVNYICVCCLYPVVQ